MDPPAYYPNFVDLAQQINNLAAEPIEFRDSEPVDQFLGRLNKLGIDVHRIVQSKLKNPASRPTKLHSSILRLFRNPEDIRIVTTNFDNHFSFEVDSLPFQVPSVKK